MPAMATTFENGTEQYPVEELWVDTVGVQSVDIDWQQAAGEYGEGFQSFEAPECGECGSYGRWDDEASEWRCEQTGCDNNLLEVALEDDAYNNGPMMNYYYRLPDLRRVGDDLHEAAYRIRDLPLCVVEFEDGDVALALTGGGMDLSWEICEAFTRLGYLPPLHFCDLPRLAGKRIDGDAAYTVRACLRSCEVAEYQAQRTRDRLAEFTV